jgi:NADH-quinone oxidoreductase subunit N
VIALLAQVEPIDLPHVEYSRFLPILILIGGALGILVVAAIVGRKVPEALWTTLSVLTAGAAGVAAAWLWNDIQRNGPGLAVAGALRVDGFSVWFAFVICSAVVLFSLMVDGYVQREQLGGPEVHVLALLSASGGVLMAFSNDLLVLFLGLEILSIALYVMAGYHRRRDESGEAAMKYFVLGAFSSAIFLYGVALMYGATGTTRLDQMRPLLGEIVAAGTSRNLALAGMALMIVGLGFKVAAVPFHTWTPDVYQGAPSPATGFMAAAAKAAGFAGLLRVFFTTFSTLRLDWRPVVWVLAVVTLLVGSVLAVVQSDIKRMLAYSSISHAGYVLIGLQAASDNGIAGSLFYLLAYTFMVLGSFAVITIVGRRGDADHDLSAYRGLAARRPALAMAFTIFLLAQAGVPFTTGFLAKFYVISAAVEARSYALGLIGMLSAVIAAFFYLRITVLMYAQPSEAEMVTDDDAPARLLPVPVTTGLAVTAAVAFTVAFGLVPSPMIHFARQATLML